jgi:PrtD family type I secretion system ABC transporter
MSSHNTEIRSAITACRGVMLIVAASSLCSNVLALASPIYMLQLYDRVIASGSTDTLIMLTVIVILALALLTILDGIRRRILTRIAAWLGDRMGPLVLAGGVRIAVRDGNNERAAQGLRDLTTLRGFFTGPAIAPLLDAPWTPLFVVSLFLLHPLLGAIGCGGAVLLFGLAVLNEAATKAPLLRGGVAIRNMRYRTEAALRNAEVIRAMDMLDGIVGLWRRDSDEVKATEEAAETRGTTILAITKFSRLALQILIMGAGAWLAIQKDGSAGVIFASSFLLSRALAPVENAIGTWKSLVGARQAYLRLKELLAAAPPAAKAMPLPRPEGALSVEWLTCFPAGAEAPTLRGVSFALQPGEVLGIIGPSAAGKSTLARLIAGTWTPTSGHVRLDGADMSVWLDSGGAKHLGYLPQDVELFTGSVRDNIARLTNADPAEVIEAAKLVGLHELIMRLPRAYDSDIGEAGVKLSGGQRQRVALARAVFGRPRLVVLDEPNASLDSEGEEALADGIAHLKAQSTTVIVVTHRPSVLQHADKLLLLRNGLVEAFGARDEVIAKLNAAAARLASARGEDLKQTA